MSLLAPVYSGAFLFYGVSMYTYDEVVAASLEYFDGDDLAANVWITKYALKDSDGNILENTPDDMHRRLAKEFARIEKNKFEEPLTEDEIYECFKNFERIIPQGSPMYGIGNNYKIVSLSNCFLLSVPLDSYNSILDVDKELVNISKRRGGVGIDLSKLRPKGSPTKNAAHSSTGIVSWMKRYSNSIREVGQNNRRGALILTLSIHHPDILDFIVAKQDLKEITGANISVRLTNEFMDAVKNDKEYELRFPIVTPIKSKKIKAKEVWNTIVQCAYDTGEPGLIMWDNVLQGPADCYDKYRSRGTNPCSEITLSPLDSCRLMCINLFSFVKNVFTKDAYFDYDELYKCAVITQRLMDDMVDLESEKIDQIINKIKSDPEPDSIKCNELEMWKTIKSNNDNGRRTGTGVTAVGDVLAGLNVKYGTNKSIEIVEKIYQTIKLGCYRSSVNMANELGAFKEWDYNKEKDCEFLLRIKEEDPKLYSDMKKYGRRNVSLLTSAPTGSVSILTQTTSGIEPLFKIDPYIRRRKITDDDDIKPDFIDKTGDRWQHYEVYHPKLKQWIDLTNKPVEKSPWYGACANDIDWINRVKIQAVAQKHVCHSISSTINLPKDVDLQTIENIYITAFDSGCKGITVYRDGCRDGVLVSKEEKETIFPEERPRELPCDVHHITIKGQQYFILVGLLDNKPYEVFAGKNGFLPKKVKTGTIIRKRKDFYKAMFDDADEELSPITASTEEMEEVVTRLTSGLLRVGADMHFVVKQLEKVGERQTEMYSFARSVARALKKYIPDGTEEGGNCPECDSNALIRQEGCVVCQSCGYSKCL